MFRFCDLLSDKRTTKGNKTTVAKACSFGRGSKKEGRKGIFERKIKSNVPKSVADEIREAGLDGVKVDEDYKRYYPFGTLASKVLGFAGADNQEF